MTKRRAGCRSAFKRSVRRCALASLLVSASLLQADSAETLRLEVSAGKHARNASIASIELPASLRTPQHLSLTRVEDGRSVPVQIDRTTKPPRAVWIIQDALDVGTRREYRLAAADGKPSPTDGISVNDDGKHLVVTAGDKPVFRYNHATVPSPDPKTPYYAKSGYIHPLYSPSGRLVTDDFNPDHAHQHGIMLAWRKMVFEGRKTDGWDQKSNTGKVEHAKIESFTGGPVFGQFRVSIRHVDLTAPGGEKPVLNETWNVRVYVAADGYLFDIDSTQTCASASPVLIDKIHYGGIMIRGHADWHDNRSYDFLTSEGKTKADGNQSRPKWVDLTGPVDGEPAGVLILDHPSNFRFPQPVRLHPTMPYFCFTPASLDAFTIESGKTFCSSYRFFVHDGTLDVPQARRLWDDYAEPVQVRVLAR